jgi:hypothetical protein
MYIEQQRSIYNSVSHVYQIEEISMSQAALFSEKQTILPPQLVSWEQTHTKKDMHVSQEAKETKLSRHANLWAH